MPQRKKAAGSSGPGEKPSGVPRKESAMQESCWGQGNPTAVEHLRPPALVLRDAQRSVFDEEEDGFQLLTATNKTPSVSAEVESTLFQ